MSERMQQDYGQWYQLPGAGGPFDPITYECRWVFSLNQQNFPVKFWRLHWRPSTPKICIYYDPSNSTTPFACRSPYDPFYDSSPNNQGNQFFLNINNIINSFDTNNTVSPPPLSPTTSGGVVVNPNGDQGNTAVPPPNPPPPDQSNSILQIHGAVFSLFLNHQQVQTIATTLNVAATLVPNPFVVAALVASATFLESMDQIGGNNGVDVSGILGTPDLMITPHGVVNIFKVVAIIQGAATQIADETSATAAQAFQDVQNAITSAGSALDQAKQKVTNFFQNPFG